jgi:hypothetical protein
MNADIFTLLEEAINFALYSHAEFGALVKPGNRRVLTGSDPNPIKPQLTDSDVPEGSLVPTSATTNLFKTSNSTGIEASYSLSIRTRSKTTPDANRLRSAAIRAVAAVGDRLLDLGWSVKTRVTAGQMQAEATDEAGFLGWANVLTIECELFVPRWETEGLP